jgi:hypothetical protein
MHLKVFLLLIFTFYHFHTYYSQEPIVKGNVNISITKGTIECDLILTDFPHIKDYIILLNKGLNVRYFRNLEDNNNYAYDWNYYEKVSGESVGYFFPDNTGKAKFLPKGFQLSYVGAFPVISDTLRADNRGDWKGNIAFNGKTIRASEQCAWYPILYDIVKDIKYKSVKYDIEVNCKDCEALYLNGSVPKYGKSANFKSDKPCELLLFAGNYKIVNVDSTYFLNPDITDRQLSEIGKMTDDFKKFYKKRLSIEYGSKITYIQTTPVSKYNSWLFVTYPSIVNVGNDMNGLKGLFDEKSGKWFRFFIGHELAHYYFGTYKVFNTEISAMFVESFAEYLSLSAAKEILGDSIYREKIAEKIKKLQNFKAIPFSKIRSEKDYENRNLYLYDYGPIILIAIEKEIGQEKMWKWLQTILNTKTEFTNYDFLKQTLEIVLKDKSKMDAIDEKYLKSDIGLKNALEIISN